MKSNLFRGSKLVYLMVMPVLLCVALSAPVGQALAAWSPPESAPPGGNVAAPINTSSSPQTKNGSLTVAGEFLSVSSGSLYIPYDNTGIFWFNGADLAKPHINFGANTLYVSPGDIGDHIELQGKVKISQAGANVGQLSVQNLINGGAGCGGVSTDNEGTLVCGGGGGGGFWTQVGANLYPTNLSWNVGIGTNNPSAPLAVGASVVGYKSMFTIDSLDNNGSNAMGIDWRFGGSAGFPWGPDGSNGRIAVERQLGSNTFDMIFFTTNTGAFAERMRILGDGTIRIPGLTGCTGNNTVDVDANGNLFCGVDQGAGASLWEAGATANTINPINETTDKVAIGHNNIGDSTQLSVKNGSLNAAGYFEQANANGYAGYFSGKTVVMGGRMGINTVSPNQELGIDGDLAMSGGLYKLNGTTKFFADCAAGNSIRAIAADGTVTCEFDDFGAAGSDTFMVMTSAADATPEYLGSELVNGTGIWTQEINVGGGNHRLQINTLWTHNGVNSVYPAEIDDKVRVGQATEGDLTAFATYNNSVNSAIYAEQLNAAGFAGYFSGRTALMNGNVGIGTTTMTEKLTIAGNIQLSTTGGLLKFKPTAGFASIYTTGTDLRLANGNGNEDRITILTGGNVGIGDTAPTSLLTVGSSHQFQVDSTGNIIKLRNITYSWPNAQGGVGTYLKNDGSGNLSWAIAGGSSLWEAGASANTINPNNEATDKVAIGHNNIGDSTQLSVKNNSANAAIYGEQTNAAGYAGYFSGQVSARSDADALIIGGMTTDRIGLIGVASNLTPNQALTIEGKEGIRFYKGGVEYLRLNNSGGLAIASSIYKLDGTTKYFSDCAAGSSIRAIAADGSVTCETDDLGGGGIGGSGTINYLPKFTAGTTLGDSQIFDNGTNVGIGTATLTEKLTVAGNIQFSTTGSLLKFKPAAGYASVYTAGNDLRLANGSGNEDRITILTGGNVGVGTTTPRSLLNMYKDTASPTVLLLQNTNTGQTAGDGLEISIAGTGEAYVGSYENKILSLGTQGRSDLNITGTGKVGIGQTGPNAKLTINAGSSNTGNANDGLGIYANNASGSALYAQQDGTGWAATFSGKVGIPNHLILQGRDKPVSISVCEIGTDVCLGRYIYTTGTTRDNTATGVKFWYDTGSAISSSLAYAAGGLICPPNSTEVSADAYGTNYYLNGSCTGAAYLVDPDYPYSDTPSQVCIDNTYVNICASGDKYRGTCYAYMPCLNLSGRLIKQKIVSAYYMKYELR